MSQQTHQCYNDVQLEDFLDQRVDQALESRIVAHLDSCKLCRESLEKISGNETMSIEIKQYFRAGELAEASEFLPADQVRDLQRVHDMLGPSENPKMLGRLGQYEVCGIIGRGSAGVVVKALDPRLNRFVAIKLLAPAYSNVGCSRHRFEREGRAIASVKDPHVMPVHAVDEYLGTPYIVMQYMPDGSLQKRIDDAGPMSTMEVVCVGMQIAKGLSAAHRLGIVHRDVKPANVLLANGIESAVVTDFGLARVIDETTLTRSGSISGTPQYMSPEQAKGEKVDLRSDLFSLGSVMYAAATGHHPFKSESVFGVIKKVCERNPPSIRESNADIMPWLEAFIDKLMSKNPDDRFASAEDVTNFLSFELAHLQNPTLVSQPERAWCVHRQPRKPVKPAVATESTLWSPWKFATAALTCALLVSLSAWIFSQIPAANSNGSTVETDTVSVGDKKDSDGDDLRPSLTESNRLSPREEREKARQDFKAATAERDAARAERDDFKKRHHIGEPTVLSGHPTSPIDGETEQSDKAKVQEPKMPRTDETKK